MDLILSLQPIAEELRQLTQAMRTNVRVQTTNDDNYPVLAEALDDGAFSLTGGISMLGYQGGDIHNAPTVRMMRTTGATIVQSDTTSDPPLVPTAKAFGGQAGQMLAPLHHEGQFCGFIAVHSHGEPRKWSASDQDRLAEAVLEVQRILGAASWFEVPAKRLEHLLLVLSNPVEGREDEYNEWYSGRHIRETLETPGWSAARRFVLSDEQLGDHLPRQRYLALYEVESPDAATALAALRGRASTITPNTSISPDDVVAVFTPITERIEAT